MKLVRVVQLKYDSGYIVNLKMMVFALVLRYDGYRHCFTKIGGLTRLVLVNHDNK